MDNIKFNFPYVKSKAIKKRNFSQYFYIFQIILSIFPRKIIIDETRGEKLSLNNGTFFCRFHYIPVNLNPVYEF